MDFCSIGTKALREAVAPLSSAMLQRREGSNRGSLSFFGPSCNEIAVGGVTGSALVDRRVEVSGPMGSSEFEKYNRCSSGLWLEFSTNSPVVTVDVVIDNAIFPDNMSRQAAVGIDVCRWEGDGLAWLDTCIPKTMASPRISTEIRDGRGDSWRTYRVYAPLFARVRYYLVGIERGFCIARPSTPFEGKPILFYGSSVTQGCAAARPSLSYPSLVGAALCREVYNFGFSSSAYGEPEIAAAIGALDLDAVVIEYDHNVEVEELRRTHETFARTIRDANRDVPLLLLTRMSGGLSCSEGETRERVAVVRSTFEKMTCGEDGRIALLEGDAILPHNGRDRFFADDRHPNQWGMALLADAVSASLKGMIDG